MASVSSVKSDFASLSQSDQNQVISDLLPLCGDSQLTNIANKIDADHGYDLIIQRPPAPVDRVLITKTNGGFPRIPITPKP